MRATATVSSASAILPFRVRYREDMNCQVVLDSIHRRAGWTTTYELRLDDTAAGFGTVAIGGPWTGRPTIIEFYLLPPHRGHAFRLFETLLDASRARWLEVQSNDALLAVMMHTYAHDITSESIVFRDALITSLTADGATLEPVTSEEETRAAIARRQGGAEWRLRWDETTVATGGILFHYNEPYGDVYMEVAEPFRRRGFGAYLVQELKRVAYELGSIPGARCSTNNIPSRATLQKAGMVPYAHILSGSIAQAAMPVPGATL